MSTPGSLKICVRSTVTPGIAVTTMISHSSSKTSAGGSHAAGMFLDPVGRKNWRCSLAACPARAQTCAYIQTVGSVLFDIVRAPITFSLAV